MSGGPSTSSSLDAVADVGRVGGDRVEHQLADLVAARVPVARRPARRARTGRRRSSCGVPAARPRGRRRSGSRAPRSRCAARPARTPRTRPVRRRAPAVIVTIARCGLDPARRRVKVGSRLQRDVQLHHRASRTCQPSSRSPVRRRAPRRRRASPSARFGSALETTIRRPDQLAALEPHPLAGQDPRHRHPGGERGAGLAAPPRRSRTRPGPSRPRRSPRPGRCRAGRPGGA